MRRFLFSVVTVWFLLCSPNSAMCVAPDQRLVVIEPLSCEPLSSVREKVLAEWAKPNGLPVEAIEENVKQVQMILDHNKGAIIHALVLQERSLWYDSSQHAYRPSPWSELNQARDFYYPTRARNPCSKFKLKEQVTLFSGSSCCDVEPPAAIDCALGMQLVDKLPRWSREFANAAPK